MKKIVLSALFAFGVVVGIEAAPTDTVTQADLQVILQRLSALEAQNKEQAKRIAELEGKNAELAKKADTALATMKRAPAGAVVKDGKVVKVDEGAEISESGKIVTAATGRKYYLADATANIFEPLSESGLQITPYGYLVFEAVHNTKGTEADIYADYVRKDGRGNGHQSVFSVQDSIFGIQFATPERFNGWKFSGKMEMDLAGDNAKITLSIGGISSSRPKTRTAGRSSSVRPGISGRWFARAKSTVRGLRIPVIPTAAARRSA